MKIRIAIAVSALILGIAGVSLIAQGPLYDKVIVDLPYTVTVSNTNLPPGHYVIRQFDSRSGDSRILQIFSNDGMKLETTVQTIPTLDNNTPRDTKVMLHHYGSDYYFDKIWIQGKNYGYEFVLPDSVKAREKERLAPYTVAATYQSAPAESGTTTTADNSSVTAAPPAATTETQSTQSSTESQSTVAQSTTPAPDNTAVASTPAPQAATVDHVDNGRSRKMPSTAANWLGMLLSGGLLSGAGMTLRRWVR